MQKEWLYERLESIQSSLASSKSNILLQIYSKRIGLWLKQMEPVKYSCLGCETRFAAVAANALNQSFPETAQTQSLSCSLEIKVNNNHAHCNTRIFWSLKVQLVVVAVSTLASKVLVDLW
jgi:uncharacterized protein with PIN domain